MKTRNLVVVLLMAVTMLFGTFAIAPITAKADEPEVEITEVGTWNELLNAVNSDKTNIKLKNSIEDIVPDDELPTKHRLLFNGGMDYVLDLNGYKLEVLNHINEYYTGEFSMIDVSNNSKLEVKNGTIIFDNYSAKAKRQSKGVVAVTDESSLTAIDVTMYNKYTGTVVYANSLAKVILEGGEYSVQNGFALYLENNASLTLNGPYIHTVMGDGAHTQYVDGYGALYSESTGELVINDAFFKSGVQVTSSQIDAFSIATHEVTINGQKLTEDIFVGTNYEAKNQNKEYYWYSWTGCALCKTENSSFVNPIRVISYEKKYPITVESGVAMVDGIAVTEASYGQEVTIVANTPEEGMDFTYWNGIAVLEDKYSVTTTFTMPPNEVSLKANYGKEAVKSISVTIEDIVPGQKANEIKITLENGVTLESYEWREEASLLMGDYAVFKAGKSYSIKMLVYPPEGNKFGDTVSATVNGKNATVSANSQYAYIDYTFEATPSAGFAIVYDINNSQLGVGGKIILNTQLMASQSAEFNTALEAGKVTYQWYRNGEAIEGATNFTYDFKAEDIACIFYVVVTANGKINYGHNVTCSSDLYQIYLKADGIVAGGKVPQITVTTPGISIDLDSMAIYEILGENSYGNPKNVENALLIPGKSYRLVGMIVEYEDIDVAPDANVYINDVLQKDKLDSGRFFYEFTVPEADYPVYYKANGEIGIGVTLTVDVDKMCNESATFKHAVEVQASNPTYKTVFYQWYKDGLEINGATKDEYTVKSTDINSLINCKVTLVDGKCGVGDQQVISNVITVINVKMAKPKHGEVIIPNNKVSADGVNVKIAWYTPLGAQMQPEDTYEEGVEYEILINFEAKDGLSLDYTGDKTKAYIYGVLAPEGGYSATGIAYYTTVIASHKHEYSDDVWDNDEYSHWQVCIKPNCPDPDEELEGNVPHWGGGATCQTAGICGECGATYYADHDFSVPDYQYVDDTKCANFCEHCDVYVDWSYHEGGVSTCQNKSVCEFCHHEYGELAPCSGGVATCTQKAKCETCGNEYGELAPHEHGTEWKNNSSEHWNECSCGDKANKSAHTDADEDGKCDVCDCQIVKGGNGNGSSVGIVIAIVVVVAGVGVGLFFVLKKKGVIGGNKTDEPKEKTE